MEYFYCDKWSVGYKSTLELWDAHVAAKAHATRAQYSVLVGSSDTPRCFIFIKDTFLWVGVLDNLLRDYVDCNFRECQYGRLLLTMATFRTFDGDSDNVTEGSSVFFKENGRVAIETPNLKEGWSEQKTLDFDISGNWTDYPNFGSYENVLRVAESVAKRVFAPRLSSLRLVD